MLLRGPHVLGPMCGTIFGGCPISTGYEKQYPFVQETEGS
jgi:hypothetical protein